MAGDGVIIGASSGLRQVMERVALVARSDVPALLVGETGSGKEVVARAIHAGSARADRPFLRVNCGAIPPELIDSELFGHERGSFTGATAQRQGWFERAHGGTLLLDEIGELPLAAQVRLLRILQDGRFERVGGSEPLRSDVRIIAATHRDLPAMIAGGAFREDLWYRIAVFPIRIPALRERPEDIAGLAAHFAARAAHRFGMPVRLPSDADIRLLTAYSWPGNVRELASVIDRATILGSERGLDIETAIGVPHRPHAPAPGVPAAPEPAGGAPFPTLDEATAAHIRRALELAGGRVEGTRGAAALLGINPHTLRGRMRKLGIEWSSYRGDRAPRSGGAGDAGGRGV